LRTGCASGDDAGSCEPGREAQGTRLQLVEIDATLDARRALLVRAYGLVKDPALRDEARRAVALCTLAELEEARKKGKEAVVGAIAIRGVGVLETLFAVLQSAYRSLDARAGLSKNIGLTEKEFLTQVFQNIDTRGSELERIFPPRVKTP
jgi:hypothetical protein